MSRRRADGNVFEGRVELGGRRRSLSRRDSTSLKVRGVPQDLLDSLDRAAEQSGRSRNGVLRDTIRDYAAGKVTPSGSPPPFDSARANAPYPEGTTHVAISGIAPDILRVFIERGRDEGWHSKNALIIALLRGVRGA